MKIINNTTQSGCLLESLLDSKVEDKLELFHQLLFLSKCYDIVLDNGDVIVCDKE